MQFFYVLYVRIALVLCGKGHFYIKIKSLHPTKMNLCKIETEPEIVFYKDIRFWALATSAITFVLSIVDNYPIVI
jgi:hypothetical protein